MNKIIKEDSSMRDGGTRKMGMNKPENRTKSNIVGGLMGGGENQFSPPPLPFPLESFNNIATDLFIQILNLRKMVDTVKNNSETYMRNKSAIDTLQIKLENIGKSIVEVSNIIDTIKQ
jgi:hypothetical protein